MTKEIAMKIVRAYITETDDPGVTSYYGIPIQKFTKEELIEILTAETTKIYRRVHR